MKFLDTPNLNNIRAGALDIRAHRVEEVGHIHDVGLLGHILHHSQAIGKGGSQHDIDGGAHRDFVQEDVGAGKTPVLSRLGIDEAALNLHIGTEGFEPLQVLINGAGSAKITAPGESNICQTKAAQQRADQIIRGPAAAGRVIRNTGVVHMGAINFHSVEINAAHIGTQILKDG